MSSKFMMPIHSASKRLTLASVDRTADNTNTNLTSVFGLGVDSSIYTTTGNLYLSTNWLSNGSGSGYLISNGGAARLLTISGTTDSTSGVDVQIAPVGTAAALIGSYTTVLSIRDNQMLTTLPLQVNGTTPKITINNTTASNSPQNTMLLFMSAGTGNPITNNIDLYTRFCPQSDKGFDVGICASIQYANDWKYRITPWSGAYTDGAKLNSATAYLQVDTNSNLTVTGKWHGLGTTRQDNVHAAFDSVLSLGSMTALITTSTDLRITTNSRNNGGTESTVVNGGSTMIYSNLGTATAGTIGWDFWVTGYRTAGTTIPPGSYTNIFALRDNGATFAVPAQVSESVTVQGASTPYIAFRIPSQQYGYIGRMNAALGDIKLAASYNGDLLLSADNGSNAVKTMVGGSITSTQSSSSLTLATPVVFPNQQAIPGAGLGNRNLNSSGSVQYIPVGSPLQATGDSASSSAHIVFEGGDWDYSLQGTYTIDVYGPRGGLNVVATRTGADCSARIYFILYQTTGSSTQMYLVIPVGQYYAFSIGGWQTLTSGQASALYLGALTTTAPTGGSITWDSRSSNITMVIPEKNTTIFNANGSATLTLNASTAAFALPITCAYHPQMLNSQETLTTWGTQVATFNIYAGVASMKLTSGTSVAIGTPNMSVGQHSYFTVWNSNACSVSITYAVIDGSAIGSITVPATTVKSYHFFRCGSGFVVIG